MHLVAANSGTNALTVVRGANGSTAASHAAGTPISIYAPPADIAEIALRWAGWLYKMEDAGDFGSASAEPAIGSIAVPPAIPPDLVEMLASLRLGSSGR